MSKSLLALLIAGFLLAAPLADEALAKKGGKSKGRTDMERSIYTDLERARGRIEVSIFPALEGREERVILRLTAHGLSKKADYDIIAVDLLNNPAGNLLLASVSTNGKGNLNVSLDTKRGTFPTDVTMADLEGRRIWLRGADGVVVLYGDMPVAKSPEERKDDKKAAKEERKRAKQEKKAAKKAAKKDDDDDDDRYEEEDDEEEDDEEEDDEEEDDEEDEYPDRESDRNE
ncbi:MAG: hypothetical protein ACYTDX_00395 [Planctomycetota bacterium]|jgi:hypothetical protein